MKYDYERDARTFGFKPALFMSMIEHELRQTGERDAAYERALMRMYHLNLLLREKSDVEVIRAQRHQQILGIAVAVAVTAAVAVFMLL